MSSRYWVGGTANWDGTAGTKWALTSGGAGGQAVPTSADNVFFDGNSGAGTITIATVNANCLNLDCTGFNGTLSDDATADLNVSGLLKFVAGMTYVAPNNVNFTGTGAQTITTAGKQFNSVNINGSGLTVTAQDDISATTTFNIQQGTFDANGHNISFKYFISNSGSTRGITMGSGTWTFSGTVVLTIWNVTSSGLTFNAGTSTLVFNGSGSNARTFAGAGLTYNNVTFTADNYTITGSNIFNTLTLNTGGLVNGTIFTNGTTQTVSSFVTNSSAGNLSIIKSDSAGVAFTMNRKGGVTIVDYMSIKDSTVGGGYWYAGTHSTNVSGNTGWVFTGYPTGNFLGVL